MEWALRACTLSPHLVSTPCPHTLSNAEERAAEVSQARLCRPRVPALPTLPGLPGLPVARARIFPTPRRMTGGRDGVMKRGMALQLWACSPAPRLSLEPICTRRGRRVYQPDARYSYKKGLSGHPAWRTTCASGFECADPDALSFPPLAAAYADSAGTVGTDVQSSQLVPAAKTPVLLATVPPSGGSGSGASAPFP